MLNLHLDIYEFSIKKVLIKILKYEIVYFLN